jgi:NADH dehydrogenase FAD-containing subunit
MTFMKRIVLVGAGHAHLEVIRRGAEFTRAGVEFVVVSPGDFWYSGLATGVLAGLYPVELDRVDVGSLTRNVGGRFISAAIERVIPENREIVLADRSTLAYDFVSLNIGGSVPVEKIQGDPNDPRRFAVKPISRIWNLHKYIRELLCDSTIERPIDIVVAGGGATGVEIAASIAALVDRTLEARVTAESLGFGGRIDRTLNRRVSLKLLAATPRILIDAPARAAESIERTLLKRDIEIITNTYADRIEGDRVLTRDGRSFRFDVLVEANGLRVSDPIIRSNLPYDDSGLIVDETLRSIADPLVFAAGDCASPRGTKLVKAGVYAVRQASILAFNLLASVEGREPRRFHPRKKILLILNLGDGTGLATWGPFWFQGRAAFRLKDRIDRKFLDQYKSH